MSIVKIPIDLMVRSESLFSIGVDEVVWALGDVVRVLEILDRAGVAVLGGDVYRRENFGFEPTYENWHAEKDRSESAEEFAKRSRIVAREFINGLSGRECWVSLVCSEPLEAGGELESG
jgi:hypothetical protein